MSCDLKVDHERVRCWGKNPSYIMIKVGLFKHSAYVFYLQCNNHRLCSFTKAPGVPWDLKATESGTTHVILEWKESNLTTKGGLSYIVSSLEQLTLFLLW